MRSHTIRALLGAGMLLLLGIPTGSLEGQGPPASTRVPTPPRGPLVSVPGSTPQAMPQGVARVRGTQLALTSVATGWLGIRVQYEIIETTMHSPAGAIVVQGGSGGVDRTYRVRVEEVVPNGPARAAGMAAGDRVLQINGTDASRAIEQGTLASIQPGQVVQFVVEREGRIVRLQVVAARRPEPAVSPTTVAVTRLRTDSIVSLMQVQMDSARANLAREVVALRSVTGQAARPAPPAEPRTWIAARAGFPADTFFATGNRARVVEVRSQTLPALVREATARGAAPGPIIVMATGQRVVLGAEITPVNSGLAAYFGVNAGLLVTQVVEGAPGARGGLTPGDVVVRVGTQPVATVEEFRTAAEAGFRSPPLVLGVIREGRRLELRIPR